MPKPLGAILSRRLLLYPEIAGADEKNDDRKCDAERVRRDVVRPLLQSGEISHAPRTRRTPTGTPTTTARTPPGWRTTPNDGPASFADSGTSREETLPDYTGGEIHSEQENDMETLTLTLHKSKDTKNKVVYGTADGTVIQSVYIDKDALGKEPPEKVKVVISAE